MGAEGSGSIYGSVPFAMLTTAGACHDFDVSFAARQSAGQRRLYKSAVDGQQRKIGRGIENLSAVKLEHA